MRRLVPDAATGAIWFGEGVFTAALEPHLGTDVRALEVGCGDGRIANLIAPRLGELHCCDVSQAMLSEAAGNLASHRNVQLVPTSGLTLEGIEGDPFDLVYAHDVLVTLDPDSATALLDAMRRALRPGGTCVVSVLTIDRPAWARDLRQWGPPGRPRALRAHRPRRGPVAALKPTVRLTPRRLGGVATQRPAKPFTPVRFR